MDRRLAAILATDVVGYSRLVRANEEATLAEVKAIHADLIAPSVSAHRGRVVKLMGDGMLAEFASVVDAVRAAVAIQQEMAGRQTDIRLRAGINLGDIVIDGDDIHGDGVNLAARLESIADPGSVFVSAAVYDQVRDRLDLAFSDMGERSVRNIDRPVRVWRWAAGKDDAQPAPAEPAGALPLPDKPSVVVLPFANMSNDPEQEYFSDGVTEDIITDLSKVSGLFVIARNSAFVYKDRTFSVPDVCRELGVRFALEGSIRKADNRVRITAQLIDGSSGGHLWAERYDRDLTDIFEVQDDVTQRIVGALEVTLSELEKSLIADGGTRNVDSHDHYLRGRDLLFGLEKDRDMFERAIACFRRAIELDPEFSSPYAGLGMVYALDHQNRWSDAADRSLDRAEHFVREAIARDDKDHFAHYVASVVAILRGDYRGSAQESDRALSLNANYPPALSARGLVYIYTGEPERAIPFIERAMRLDPNFQQQFLHFLGLAHFVAGDYATASTLFQDRIAINPSTDLSRAFLVSALGHLGRPGQAREIWAALKEINPRYSAQEHIGRLPFENPADAAKFTEGLRKAGIDA